MKRAIIGLGSNQGDRSAYLMQARAYLEERIGCILRSTLVIETTAWGFDAPPFLNQAVLLQTELPPLALLDELQSIERILGRRKKTQIIDGHPAYQNRTIDLDILDYDGLVYSDERLTLPHPQIVYRDFIQEELRELGQPQILSTMQNTIITKETNV